MSDKPTPEETAIWQRRLAGQANNRAWALAEALTRTAEEDEEMLQAAHAAMRGVLNATLRVIAVPTSGPSVG
mgnify:CR=1 FL=1